MTNLAGKLLISQPAIQTGHFSKSVILVAQHSKVGAWGVVVNKIAKTITMKTIMETVGIEYHRDEAIYIGGPVETNRVHVVHSLDWSSSGTMCVTDEIGITGDVSVLAAISAGVGPEYYRAGIGLAVWSSGQLDGEMTGSAPWKSHHQWLTADGTIDLCLNGLGDDQWNNAVGHCIQQRVSEFF